MPPVVQSDNLNIIIENVGIGQREQRLPLGYVPGHLIGGNNPTPIGESILGPYGQIPNEPLVVVEKESQIDLAGRPFVASNINSVNFGDLAFGTDLNTVSNSNIGYMYSVNGDRALSHGPYSVPVGTNINGIDPLVEVNGRVYSIPKSVSEMYPGLNNPVNCLPAHYSFLS